MPLASLPELCYNITGAKEKQATAKQAFAFLAPLANEPSAIADNERDSAGSRAVAGTRFPSARFESGRGVSMHAGEKGDLLWKKNRITIIPKG